MVAETVSHPCLFLSAPPPTQNWQSPPLASRTPPQGPGTWKDGQQGRPSEVTALALVGHMWRWGCPQSNC